GHEIRVCDPDALLGAIDLSQIRAHDFAPMAFEILAEHTHVLRPRALARTSLERAQRRSAFAAPSDQKTVYEIGNARSFDADHVVAPAAAFFGLGRPGIGDVHPTRKTGGAVD